MEKSVDKKPNLADKLTKQVEKFWSRLIKPICDL
jgi:hypothetical protein